MLKLVGGTVLATMVFSALASAPAPPPANGTGSAALATEPGVHTATASSAEESGAPQACTDASFVACASSEACATRGGKLIVPQTCFEHAADACQVLRCEHGCDIYGGASGEPEMIHCGVNAQSTGKMQRCAGLAGWGCPEGMTCQHVDPNVDDASGVCLPAP